MIAKLAGIKIISRTMDEIDSLSGFLSRSDMTIGVNDLDSDARKRFTISHELGHFFLHTEEYYLDKTGGFSFRSQLSSEGSDIDEIEANQFAAELLMPELRVREAIECFSGPVEEKVIQMAAAFGVSTQAMTIRLTNLGLLA